MIAGLAKALCTSTGRTTPVISSTAAPASATTSDLSLSRISAATTAMRTTSVISWLEVIRGVMAMMAASAKRHGSPRLNGCALGRAMMRLNACGPLVCAALLPDLSLAACDAEAPDLEPVDPTPHGSPFQIVDPPLDGAAIMGQVI